MLYGLGTTHCSLTLFLKLALRVGARGEGRGTRGVVRGTNHCSLTLFLTLTLLQEGR